MSDRSFQASDFQLLPEVIWDEDEFISSQLKIYKDGHSQIICFLLINTDLMKTDKNPELEASEVNFVMG